MAQAAFSLHNEDGKLLVTVYRDGLLSITDSGPLLLSQPPAGHYRVTNLYVDAATGKLVVEYDDGS